MKKKVLSIILAFSLTVQPAYCVDQPAKAPKKGVITKAKEKWSAMKEAVKRGNAVLKANWQCITKGKGEKCSPDRYLALQIIRNFVKGNTKAAKEGLQKLVQAHKDCWVPVLIMLVSAGFVSSVSVIDLFEGKILDSHGTIPAFAPAGGLVAGLMGAGITVAISPKESILNDLSWEKIKNCMLVIGIDLPIFMALAWILNRMTYKHETSKERIDVLRGKEKMAFLHISVKENDIDVVMDLLKRGADVNVKDQHGNTPLYMAVSGGKKNMVDILIKNGASIDMQNNDGFTPLFKAVLEGKKNMVDILIGEKANLEKATKKGQTPLQMAAFFRGRKDIAQSLIDAGADVNAKDKDGLTPLHFARSLELVQLLSGRGAKINAVDKNLNTPLHIAALNGFKNIAQALLKAGADANLTNTKGQKPAQLTTDAKFQAMLKSKFEGRPSPLYEPQGRSKE